jgi:hypothetical protein
VSVGGKEREEFGDRIEWGIWGDLVISLGLVSCGVARDFQNLGVGPLGRWRWTEMTPPTRPLGREFGFSGLQWANEGSAQSERVRNGKENFDHFLDNKIIRLDFINLQYRTHDLRSWFSQWFCFLYFIFILDEYLKIIVNLKNL